MAAPTVSEVVPSSGLAGVSVAIAGTGFTGATAVAFGSVAATAFNVDSDTQITATAPPPNVSGSVHVVVTNADGDSSGNDLFAYSNCSVSRFDVPTARGGCTTEPAGTGSKVGERFNMELDFSSAAGSTCSCCEYRQYVRGTFTINGTALNHLLPNPSGGAPVKMLPRPTSGAASDNFLEDGVAAPSPGINAHYGHRSEGAADGTDNYVAPDRPNGCQYRGNDFPGVRSAAGTAYSIDLDFRGTAIDVCNGNAVCQQNEWAVTCSGTI